MRQDFTYDFNLCACASVKVGEHGRLILYETEYKELIESERQLETFDGWSIESRFVPAPIASFIQAECTGAVFEY